MFWSRTRDRHIAALALILLLSPSIALAQDIPEYDSQANCERVAESAASQARLLVDVFG
jgi:hypothetical protein